ncbi:MAG: hypothetical protein V7603_4728 [Micromonosporaceae bacterium]
MTEIGNRVLLPRRLTQLALGLVAYGVSMALMIEARLGLDPWDVFLGVTVDAAIALLPTPHPLTVRVAFLAGGVLLNGVATGLYIGARLGPGPRDGLMTGFVKRRNGSIRLVRTTIEVTVLATGWLLGGSVGVGTLLYAVSIGPLAHVFIPLLSVRAPAPRPAPAPAQPARLAADR